MLRGRSLGVESEWTLLRIIRSSRGRPTSDFLLPPSPLRFCRAQETTWQGSAAGASVLVGPCCGQDVVIIIFEKKKKPPESRRYGPACTDLFYVDALHLRPKIEDASSNSDLGVGKGRREGLRLGIGPVIGIDKVVNEKKTPRKKKRSLYISTRELSKDKENLTSTESGKMELASTHIKLSFHIHC